MKTKIAVIVFPGSNCDHDAYYVLKKIFNIDVDFVWHQSTNLKKYNAILIPGGFSYGDYLRTGAIARFSPIMNSVITDAKKGKPVIGIYSGGVKELIKNGINGYLVPIDNISEIVDRVQFLIENSNERKLIEEQAVKYSKENFSSKQTMDSIIKVYKKLLN